MEHLAVVFRDKNGAPIDRRLVIDDAPTMWRTNETIDLEAGSYDISLAPPTDFTPYATTILLRNTTVTDPMVIVFTKLG